MEILCSAQNDKERVNPLIQMIENSLLQRFQQLVASRIGFQVRERERDVFHDTILQRMRALNLREAEAYHRLLQSDALESRLEWKALAAAVTNGESFFFRGKEQMALLKNKILPELIERNQQRKSLRLWSAGCSTGEEPYSLAMLVDGLLPRRDGWDILILGTDVNEEAIDKARRGIYDFHSFRGVESDWQRRYFRPQGRDWALDAQIRAMVTLQPGNLLWDEFPRDAVTPRDVDLILCRNVFIYFERDAVSSIVRKFAAALNDGGYLMTGHAELFDQNVASLRARLFPECVIYQKIAESRWRVAESPPPKAKERTAKPVVVPSPIPSPQPAIRNPQSAIRNCADFCAAAHAHANVGDYERAIQCCQQAIALDAFAVEPHYLLAHVAEEQGDGEAAKRLWKRVIYLSPSCIAAYLELAALYEREGDAARANKMRETALEFLREMPTDDSVEFCENVTVGELVQRVKEMI